MGKNQAMHPEDFQIYLKLADGSFHPLVSANGKRRIKLMITTAHRGQEKALFEFYARTLGGVSDSSVAEKNDMASRVAVLELDLGAGSEDETRELALSVELDLFDNLSLSVADPVSGALKTTEVSLSEWLMIRDGETASEDLVVRRGMTPLKLVFLILFILVSVGLVLLGTWLIATHLSSAPPPPLTRLPLPELREWPL